MKCFYSLAAAVLVLSMCGCTAENYNTSYPEAVDNSVTAAISNDITAADVPGEGISDSAKAAIVYCPDNGEILYGHDIHEKRAIASITKIMTALITLEHAAVNDSEIKITPEMYAEGSSMYLKAGDVLRLSELAKGMLAVSGNDAANAAAIGISGSMEKFAELMNEKAAQIGMKNSHFVTPSGLDSDEHYSTAYDMALLCSNAMKNNDFREIVSLKKVIAEYEMPQGKTAELFNHNRLLSTCEGCIGIKTGFTTKAGRTLTSCAERNGVRLIVVTLSDSNDWEDHCALYDYGFGLVEKVRFADQNRTFNIPFADGENQYATACPECTAEVTVRKERTGDIEEHVFLPPIVFSPVIPGEQAGRIEYRLDGKCIISVKLRFV